MAVDLELISQPYRAGGREVGMGLGPTVLLQSRPVSRGSKEGGRFPLVLAGNCNSSPGTTAGLETSELGVVWLDAHADFDIPDDNLSGFFDVMALSTLTGSCWAPLRRTIAGFREIPEDRIVLAAVRDLESYQRERLQRSRVTVVDASRILDEGVRILGPALDHLDEAPRRSTSTSTSTRSTAPRGARTSTRRREQRGRDGAVPLRPALARGRAQGNRGEPARAGSRNAAAVPRRSPSKWACGGF